MPVYEFELCNGKTGEIIATINLPLPVDSRDDVTLRRSALPRTLAVAMPEASPDQRQAGDVLNAYKRVEQRLGNNREFCRRIGHSPDQIKSAWGLE